MALKQNSTVADYRRRLEAVAALLVEEKEEIPNAAFLNGLKAEIRAELRPKYKGKERKGLCFKCDGKYFFGHKCGEKQFQVILVDEEEEDLDLGDVETSEVATTEQIQGNVELSLSSVVGINGPKTMKLKGSIMGQEVIILIDSGASHNFISREFVKKLAIAVERTQAFGVRVGDGYKVRCEGECKAVRLEVQRVQIIQDFFPFDMSSADVVLGMAWLETLGETTMNWRK
ncbi:uncharacterized protein LOC116136865 [Pistacia vera]|uniref:uncharacterized protein LOC116136865 n=1 Tax=Pistacia vera TaxID=55513 RepID=UPI001262F9DF|nr:uncharacterized protein LOC116136865 [Pistacia vera]